MSVKFVELFSVYAIALHIRAEVASEANTVLIMYPLMTREWLAGFLKL